MFLDGVYQRNSCHFVVAKICMWSVGCVDTILPKDDPGILYWHMDG